MAPESPVFAAEAAPCISTLASQKAKVLD